MRIERAVEKQEYRKYSDQWLIERFLKHGSVEEALHEDGLPIPFSYITYRRKLLNAGIIKSPGRHTSLTETLHFFRMKAMSPGTPLERLYRQMPHTFRTSVETLHRIYDKVEQVSHRRQATALILHPADDPHQVLVGSELLTNMHYGKVAGLLSIPMTFSGQQEPDRDRVLRVLQQEVFARDAIEKKFANSQFVEGLLSSLQPPTFTFDILDVRVSCYELSIPDEYSKFSSFKLDHHHFVSRREIELIPDNEIRVGVKEIVSYSAQDWCLNPEVISDPAHFVSELNVALSFTEADPNLRSA